MRALDERVVEEIVDEEISIGDYVLTGGELPAIVLTDAVCRMINGVLSSDESFIEESHYAGPAGISAVYSAACVARSGGSACAVVRPCGQYFEMAARPVQ